MSDEAEPIQLWVRNEQAKVFGPLSPTSVELLIDHGVLVGRLQVSLDGTNFVFPGRLPGPRIAFPRELWGDVVVDGPEADALYERVILPPPLPGVAPPTQAPRSAPPRARVPTAGPSSGPSAPASGPASRGASPYRPAPSQVARPPPPLAPSSDSAVRAGPQGPSVPPRPASAPSGARPVLRPAAGAAAPPRAASAPASSASEVSSVLPTSGSLTDYSPMRLYGWAAATDATALLELALSDRTIVVHFKKGAPEFIDSTHPHDALPAFLMAQGLATPAQLEEAEAQKARFGGELLPALFGLGLVNPNIVFQQIAERATAILFRALTAETGSFTCQARELPAHKALPLGNRWSLYLEQLRRTPAAEVRRRMASVLSLPVMRSGGAVPATDLKLQPQEARALQFFDGVRSLQELVGAHPMEAEVLLRSAWMLKELDLVSFEGTPVSVEADAAVPVKPPPAAAAPAGRVAAPSFATESPPPVAPVPMPVVPPRVSAPVVARPGTPPPSAAPSNRPAVGAPVGSRPLVATMGAPGAVPGNPASAPPRQAVAYPERKPAGAVPAAVSAPASTASGARPPTITAQVVSSSSSGVRGAPGGPGAAPARASASGVVAGGAAASNDTGQLTQVLEKLRKQTYFEVLNVPREADANAAKMAYFRLAKLFHPDTVPPGSPASLAKVKADLFALIGEAHRTLSDPKLKQDYLAELDSGTQGEKVDVARLLLAEELFQRGRTLVKARKWADAVKVLDEAIAANAQEGEYFGWRGFARFFLHEDKAKGHAAATRDMEYSLKLNPNAAATHYFQGYLWKMMGDLGRAKTHFKRCVELDPRHIDAQRELRMMK